MRDQEERTDGSPPFAEARPPHLPDALTRFLGPFSWTAWSFVVAAVLVAFGRLTAARIQLADVGPDLIQFALQITPGVVSCLFGAALFVRHRKAWTSDRQLVIAAVLLVGVEVLDIAAPYLRSLLPAQDISVSSAVDTPAFALSALGGVVTVVAVMLLARGLLAGRVDRSWVSSPWATTPIWIVGILAAALGFAAYALAIARGGLPGVGLIDAVVLVVVVGAAVVIVVAWSYVATVAATGSVNGEGPPNAWALAATGGLTILVGYLMSSIASVAGWLILSPEAQADWTLTLATGSVAVRAAGFLLVLGAFALGMPAIEDETA